MSFSSLARRLGLAVSMLTLTTSAACGGHEGTHLVGSAMDDAAADSSARLTLVLWPRTDSIFAGYLQAGTPVEIEGVVSAWHDKEGLVLYATSSNGDTTVFRSRQSGNEVGGQYEVTGGAHSGQGGTWRARLVDGPPPSPQTLQQYARSRWIPPLDAIWPAAVVAALLLLAVRWIRQAPELVIDPGVDAFEDHRVTGWLALFSAGQIVALVLTLSRSGNFLAFLDNGTWRTGAVVPGMRGLLVVEKLMFLLHIVAPSIGLYLIARRSRLAPRYWFAYLAAVGTFSAIELAAGSWIEAGVDRVMHEAGSSDAARDKSHSANLRAVMHSILWCCYWARSARVRRRFGHGALEEASPPPSLPDVAVSLGD